ncbi:MAG TPA: YcxB family protein [Pirellulaceae bacterium]|nr:YcxB family protein [Pirellulaceae bacterium]
MTLNAAHIVVTGLLSADDAIRAMKVLGKWRPFRTGLLFVAFLLVIAAIATTQKPDIRIHVLVVVGAIGSLVAIGWASSVRDKFTKQFCANPEIANPIVWTFSGEGLLIQTANTSSLHAWNSFEKATITPTVVILAHHGGLSFNFIPRRLFASEADYSATCQLISAKLPVRQLG